MKKSNENDRGVTFNWEKLKIIEENKDEDGGVLK